MKYNNKAVLSIVGFLLFFFGFFSLLLSMVGIKIVFLMWLDAFGSVASFVIKILMIIAGIVVIVLSRGDEARHDEYL